jgi:hypothetical protein
MKIEGEAGAYGQCAGRCSQWPRLQPLLLRDQTLPDMVQAFQAHWNQLQLEQGLENVLRLHEAQTPPLSCRNAKYKVHWIFENNLIEEKKIV